MLHDIRQISMRRGNGVTIQRSLCLYSPEEVYNALTRNPTVVGWLKFVAEKYWPPKGKKLLLLYPCSAVKPYHKSRSYLALFKTLSKLGPAAEKVHVVTVSEPFGLVPQEFYVGKESSEWVEKWYDCPGLFEWWCRKHSTPYSTEYLEASLDILSSYVAQFLNRVQANRTYTQIIGFIRTYTSLLEVRKDHTHRRILENASRLSGVKIRILPSRHDVARLVRKHGKLAWDMYGVAHPMAQSCLLSYLTEALVQK
jgi:archaeosine synthase